MTPKRIGLFGGSFDPPHIAHLAFLRAARAGLMLDKIIIMPAGQAWQKHTRTPAAQRLAMCQLAFAGEPQTIISPLEIEASAPSYTVNTVLQLQHQHPNTQLFVLIGGDQLANFCTWHEWQKILEIAHLGVGARAGAALQIPAQFSPTQRARVRAFAMPNYALSSSQIRNDFKSQPQRTPASNLVPAAIVDYITAHSLYKN